MKNEELRIGVSPLKIGGPWAGGELMECEEPMTCGRWGSQSFLCRVGRSFAMLRMTGVKGRFFTLHSSFFILLLLLVVGLSGCNSTTQSNKPTVYVSIEPLRYFAEQIAGEDWEVLTMVPKGSSPETYDPTPRQLMQLARSRVFFSVGYLGFEQQWIPRMKENAPDTEFCMTSEGITYLEGHHHHHEEGEHVEEEGKEPHVWTTPSNALVMARRIAEWFCKADPSQEESYRLRLAELEEQIRQTDGEIRQLLKDGQRWFVIYHPSLTYFAKDYGLEQLCIEEDGKEPSPARLKYLVEECRHHQVHTIFIQQEFNTQNAQIIARETGAQLVVINPLSYHWHEELLKIARSLKNEE